MSRKPRILSNSGIYHIMLRGNEKKDIFLDHSEKHRFLEGLEVKQKELAFAIYAYCIMNNHVHLLMNVHDEDLSAIMSGISVRYATFYNFKHSRVGHVFQDRFRSEAVENDRYLLAVVRYIHNNPVKAGLVEKAQDYKWSSYWNYISGHYPNFLNTSFVLSLFNDNLSIAVKEYERFSEEIDDSNFIDCDQETEIRTSDQGRAYLIDYLSRKQLSMDINDIKKDKPLRDQIIIHLRTHTALSQRVIACLLEIDKTTVERFIP